MNGILKAAGAVFGVLVCAATHAGGQATRVGRLEGTITERVRSRSSGSASIEVVRIDSDFASSCRSRPDKGGRFHIDSLPDGHYAVQLSSATLDSLNLVLPVNELQIVAGQTVRADLALPGGTAMRDAVCTGAVMGKGEGVVAGRATDTDTTRAIAGANVIVSWMEVTVDRATLVTTSQERAGSVRTGSRGEYRLCGIPTGHWLSIQLEDASRTSGITRVTVSDEEGAVVRNLSLSPREAPLVAMDSAEARPRPTDVAPRRETASTGDVTGTTPRAVTLDSVRVVAPRSRYAQFEYNRRTNLFGKFLTADDIGRSSATELTELLGGLGGFVVAGHGADATVLSRLAKAEHPTCRESNVVIDGIPRAGMNYLPPSQVAGVEIYRDGATAPGPYRGDCGLIVIWTKRYRPRLQPV
ncbi:hypothetical protein BH11GEM1_BH11GEM1_07820 [soil metagenome]